MGAGDRRRRWWGAACNDNDFCYSFISTYHRGEEKELTTPTGAALVHTLATYEENMPRDFRVESIAYGAGYWDLAIPNVLRVYFGEMA